MAYEVDVGRFFTVPLKRSQDVDLAKPIETFIKNTYDKTDDDILKHVREFNSLRKTAVFKPLDKSLSSLSVLYKYHDQLVATSKKIPFREATGVQVLFVWKDSLQKGKFLSSTPKISMADGEFERLCVLYNIAALMSQIGSEVNMQTDDGLKAAAKQFQESAGIFGHIKDRIISVAGEQQLTNDLTPEILNAFKLTMTAQAQECFYDKASSDPSLNRKPDMVAKISSQAAFLYGEAIKAFNEGETNNSLGAVVDMCNAKKDLFECRAQMYQARAANEGKQFGEAIARYRLVEPTLKNLSKSASEVLVSCNLKQLYSIVVAEKEAAEKDNNFIYNDVIPKSSTLAAIGKAQIAKAKPYNAGENLSHKFSDMFSGLVPLAVHNALESYEARRKELVDRQTERLREQTTLINGVMSSLNMPAALEDVSGNDVPASLLEKSKTVIGKGGAAPIDRLLTDLPDSLERNREILSECVRILNEEQATDAELREKFGAKWTRKPSAELTAPLRQEASKYQTIIENAQQADGIVRQKYHDSKRGIDLLSLPENELKKAVPSASPIASLKNHEVVKELKKLCEKVETLKAEREVIENELKTTSCDMSGKFTQVLAEEGALNEENISPAELDRIYQPLIEQVTESVGKQESLQANLQRASEQFSVLKQQGGGANTREEMLKEMAAAFDKYQELLAHLQEGGKFYNDLTELLLKLQGKCSDLVFARKTEKEELLKDLQQSIVSQQSASAPSVPAYHQQDVYAEVKKPARPPPPTVSAAAPSAPPPAAQPAVPKPAPRRSPAPPAPTAAQSAPPAPTAAQSAPPATSASAPAGAPPAQAPYGAHQNPPYAFAQAPPGQHYAPYPGGYGAPPAQGATPYPSQPGYPYPPQPGTYAPQGYAAYPQQPQYQGYPPQPPPGQQGYPPYGQQPPYYYPPQ